MSSQEARDRGATQCFTKVTLAAGTTTTVTTTTAATYSIGGKIYAQGAAWTNKAHPTTDSNSGAAFVNIPANYGGVVVYGTDSGGSNLLAVQGKITPLDASGAFIYGPDFPAIPDTMCPLGYLVVKCDSTATLGWTPATSNQSGVAGVTYARQDVSTLPARPQIS